MTGNEMPDAAQVPEEKQERLIDHLLELRSRLLKSIAGLLVVLLALLPFANKLYSFLAQPLIERLPANGQLIAIDVAAPFFTPLKLALAIAMVLSAPWFLYQIWAFVAPGLYRNEKRLARPLLIASVILFYLGCAFAYFIVLPAVFGFLTATTPSGVAMMTDITHYLDFVMVIFLAFGLSFELPIAIVVAIVLGAVTPKQLREWRGYAIVAIFVIAAILTPPDVLSQCLLAIPMIALYELGIIAGSWLKVKNSPAPDSLG